jgi:hypothetical protein
MELYTTMDKSDDTATHHICQPMGEISQSPFSPSSPIVEERKANDMLLLEAAGDRRILY